MKNRLASYFKQNMNLLLFCLLTGCTSGGAGCEDLPSGIDVPGVGEPETIDGCVTHGDNLDAGDEPNERGIKFECRGNALPEIVALIQCTPHGASRREDRADDKICGAIEEKLGNVLRVPIALPIGSDLGVYSAFNQLNPCCDPEVGSEDWGDACEQESGTRMCELIPTYFGQILDDPDSYRDEFENVLGDMNSTTWKLMIAVLGDWKANIDDAENWVDDCKSRIADGVVEPETPEDGCQGMNLGVARHKIIETKENAVLWIDYTVAATVTLNGGCIYPNVTADATRFDETYPADLADADSCVYNPPGIVQQPTGLSLSLPAIREADITLGEADIELSGGLKSELEGYEFPSSKAVEISDGSLEYSVSSEDAAGSILFNKLNFAIDDLTMSGIKVATVQAKLKLYETTMNLNSPVEGTVSAPDADGNRTFEIPAGVMNMVFLSEAKAYKTYAVKDPETVFKETDAILPAHNDNVVTGTIDSSGRVSFPEIVIDDGDLYAVLSLTTGAANTSPVVGIDIETNSCGLPTVFSGAESFDADGDALSYEWRWQDTTLSTTQDFESAFPDGLHQIQLVVTDVHGLSSSNTVSFLSSTDKEGPEITWTEPTGTLCDASLDSSYYCYKSCSPDSDSVSIPVPDASDTCGGVTISGTIIDSNGSNTDIAIPASGFDGVLSEGTHTVEWIAVDENQNETSWLQTIEIVSALTSKNILDLRDRASVVSANGGYASVSNYGLAQTTVGVEAVSGSLSSNAPIDLRDRSTINGSVVSSSSITIHNDVTTTGVVAEYQNTSIVGWDEMEVNYPIMMDNVALEPDQSIGIEPGAYANLIVKSRSDLILSEGTYYVDRLQLEPQSRLLFNGVVRIYVRSSIIARGEFDTVVPNTGGMIINYTGTNDVVMETEFEGRLSAPNAKLSLQNDFTGTLTAKNLEVRPDVVLTCDLDADKYNIEHLLGDEDEQF